jgi:predicted TIM-barrel fold metal-dependent hydrolase
VNIQVRAQGTGGTAASKQGIADIDLHLGPPNWEALHPFMAKRWVEHAAVFGMSHRTGLQGGAPNYPKAQPAAARRDAWPPSGKPPGTDLDFIRSQHLDPYGVEFGTINPPTPSQNFMNPALGNAVCAALNDYQVEFLAKPERRLRASIAVNYEDAEAAVAEIRRWAGSPYIGHVYLLSRTGEPLGTQRYRPIFRAAAEAGIPVAMHAFGFGGRPNTPGGWASYYIEDMLAHAQSMQAQLTSMVVEGVFEELPALKFVMIEGGFGWVPSLCWRLDKHWRTLKLETPHLRMSPSEYIRRNVWFTTQPMEETGNAQFLADMIGWIGLERLMFASDYPHWDFDDPMTALPIRLDAAQSRAYYRGNAAAVYG